MFQMLALPFPLLVCLIMALLHFESFKTNNRPHFILWLCAIVIILCAALFCADDTFLIFIATVSLLQFGLLIVLTICAIPSKRLPKRKRQGGGYVVFWLLMTIAFFFVQRFALVVTLLMLAGGMPGVF